MAGRQNNGPVPELPGDLGVRRGQGRPAVRLLRVGAARAVRAGARTTFRPESLLPLKVSESQARELIRALVQASVAGAERARSESADRHGQRASTCRTGRSTRTRMPRGRRSPGSTTTRRRTASRCNACGGRPASGELSHVFDDDLVPASLGVEAGLLARGRTISDRRGSIPYDAGYLAGWTVERYQIDLVGGRGPFAGTDGCGAAAAVCRGRFPATRTATWTCRRRLRDQRFKHILVPIWLLTYTFRREVVSGRRQRRDG